MIWSKFVEGFEMGFLVFLGEGIRNLGKIDKMITNTPTTEPVSTWSFTLLEKIWSIRVRINLHGDGSKIS
jgi:hypothetical protein